MDDKTFVLLNNQFKKECDQSKKAQQKIQTKFETAQKFQDGLTRFEKGAEGQADIEILMWDITGQITDWIAAYPSDRSVLPYMQKSKYGITLSGRLGNPIGL
ncbi:MAG: hypothetical protein HDT37_07045 [Clostridiales bacterium]|nr:hypothetical protein [Clostridiales bacterium]